MSIVTFWKTIGVLQSIKQQKWRNYSCIASTLKNGWESGIDRSQAIGGGTMQSQTNPVRTSEYTPVDILIHGNFLHK